jgi:protein-S-isoprenylcysteine O-methyltransferase Ste14
LARHPLYTGFLTACLGTTITASTGDALIGFAVILIAFLIKMRREETLLIGEFGEEYVQFRKEVPALVPMLY